MATSQLRRAKEAYWNASAQAKRIKALFHPRVRPFGTEVARSHWQAWFAGIQPLADSTDLAAKGAADWLLRAQRATPDDGVSLGYFPCDVVGGWMPSYPETTGYIIPTLLDFASEYGDERMKESALAAARWECSVQMESGAVQGGPVCEPTKQRAAVFNTGMVLQGWSAAWRASRDDRFLKSAVRAAEFLLNDMDDEGHLRTHGPFVSPTRIKTYNVLCGWGMLRIGQDTGDRRFIDGAIRMASAALLQQLPNGWFENNDLDDPDRALTHTIGYTLQGLLEIGAACGRAELVAAARKGIEAVALRIAPNGYLPGRFDRNWLPVTRSCCLTGSAQLAIVMYRLDELAGDGRLRQHADRLVNFLKAVQRHDCSDVNANGAIGGSFPLLGEYMTAGYPNWATKYFLDALLLQKRAAAHDDNSLR
jgi:hypothetical protein